MRRAILLPLVPRLTVEWARKHPDATWSRRDGTMVFADISGFTRLSEQLAELGPAGAEELTDLINGGYEGILGAAGAYGGDVLKIAGDGVLLWFDGADHEVRAATACQSMHRSLERPLMSSTGRTVRLRMSIGAHTGTFTFVMATGRHRELVAAGSAVSTVLRCEQVADPGQTVASDELVSALAPGSAGAPRPGGRLPRRVEGGGAIERNLRPPARPPDLTVYVPAAQRELLVAGAPGEHRQCAIGFLSLRGTDDILATSGPEALVDVVSRVTAGVDEATDRWGTQFLATDCSPNGVGVMLTSGIPTSSGHDEERLLRTVRQVLDEVPALDLRAGVHRGRIYSGFLGSSTRRVFTGVGDAVNLSARLMQRAGEREIVASRAVLDWSDTRFEERPLVPFTVKNRVAPVEASVVGEVAERRPRGAAHDLPFVGRERELAQLEQAADDALEGRGSLVVLVGEPGIGKSRLIVELQRRRPGLELLDLAADEYSTTVPYSLVRTMLARLGEFDPDAEPTRVGASLLEWVGAVAPDELPWLPLLAAVFGAATAPTRETEELAGEFRSARLRRSAAAVMDRVLTRPSLVVIDDAQWVDDASAELLATAFARIDDRPRLVCVLVSGGAWPPAWAAGGTVMEVEALPVAETRRLATAASSGRVRSRDLDQLSSRSAGNPLFLSNLVDAASTTGEVDSLPSTIERLITSRIDDLETRDRVLLREAAVAGMELELPLLGRVLGTQIVNRADAWRRLAPFVGRAGPGRLRFLHGLYQRVAYEGLSFRRRRELHLALGDELERTHAEPAVLSLHFWRAHDHARSYRWSRVAAEAAHAAYANTEAAELYQRALASATRTPTAKREVAELAEALGDVLELTADYDSAAAAYADARRAANGTSARTEARLHRKIGVLREHAGAYSDALRWYSRGIRLLGPDGEPVDGGRRGVDQGDLAELAELELAYGGVRYRQGRAGEATEWVGRAIDHATHAGDDRALGHAYYLMTIVEVARGETTPRTGDVAIAVLERVGDLVLEAKLYNNLGIAAYFGGDWPAALAHYERCLDLGHRAGDLVLEATVASNIGEILSDRGEIAAAAELFESALDAFTSAKYAIGVALATGNLGRAALRSGDVDRARRLLENARVRFEAINAASYVAETLVRLAECATAAGEPYEALLLVTQAEQSVRGAPDSFVAVGAVRARAEAWLAAGRLIEAATTAEEAVQLARQTGATFEQARSLEVRAAAGRALGASAKRDAEEAATLLAHLGASK
jgi:class 3 adenylate cyclase/tetratricopeptide (TPR) repeat protein